MLDDPDSRLRLAASRAVTALAREHGDVVPWAAIQAGFELDGQRVHLANRARGIFRPKEMRGGALSIKTVVPRQGRTARYADLVGPGQGTIDYCFQGEDPDGRDNRLLEWCRVHGAPLIYFYATDVAVYAPIWPVFVAEMDREGLRARLVHERPSAFTLPPEGALILRDPANTAIERRYATREVRQRLHQAAFRALVLRAYDQRCAVCDLPRMRQMVDAAHIVPDRDQQGHPDVRNGLALCALHHRAFDSDLLGVRPDAVVIVSERLRQTRDGPLLEAGLNRFHGQALRLPARPDERPAPEHLERRWESFLAAG